ncbi:hypothetical protein ARMSODRAFT_896561, partial [Armillaria solidipes]
ITQHLIWSHVRQGLTEAGYDKLTGHCFRIGGTTFYLVMGINPDVVKAIGRWTSEAFKRYWRNVEQLGILYTEMMDESPKRRRKRILA